MYYFLAIIILVYVFAIMIPDEILKNLNLPSEKQKPSTQKNTKDRTGRAIAVAMAAGGYPGAGLLAIDNPDAADYAALMGVAENGGSTIDRMILAEDLEDMLIQQAVIQYIHPELPKEF